MAGQDILLNMMLDRGQSQNDRVDAALDEHFIDVDERSTAELLAFVKKMADFVQYYADDPTIAAGNWSSFFPYAENDIDNWLLSNNDDTPAHLALLLSFLHLYKKPQEILNQFTGKHLDFFYRDILRLVKNSPVADLAFIHIELKNNAPAISIKKDNLLTAAKDATGVERLYAPTSETVINSASIVSLRSIFIDPAGNGIVRYAPIANSADGLGAKLDKEHPAWKGFGYAELPVAETGFALASPVLRMREGIREITIVLNLSNSSRLSSSDLTDIFSVYISAEKSWIGPYPVTPELTDNSLKFSITLTEDEAAIVDYKRDDHGYKFEVQAPVMQVFLNTGQSNQTGYQSFNGVRLEQARIEVVVNEVKNLQLESDAGTLNAAKAFMPFGPQPGVGSRFKIGCVEALSKKLSDLSLYIHWKGAEANFSTYYDAYSTAVSNASFTANVSFSDAGSLSALNISKSLFDSTNASAEHTISFSTSPSAATGSFYGQPQVVQALSNSGSSWAIYNLSQILLISPIYFSLIKPAVEAVTGFISFSLNRDFLHKAYRKEHTKNLMTYAKVGGTLTILNEPYTPEIQSIKLSYTAFTNTVEISSTEKTAFANNDLLFFHLNYFGQKREHGYQRDQFDFLLDKSVTLMPEYNASGELLIGVEKLRAGDSVSLLFQLAEGSADPELSQQKITWSVLCDNYWKDLGVDELISDSTNQLLTSGLIKFVIPSEATLTNTILAADNIWLKASVAGQVDALSQIVDIKANVIEVAFVNQHNDPHHLASPLPADSIKKFKNNISGVKKIQQPYASFGGNMMESNVSYRTRVSERLRHKDRALTSWDIERIVLQQFPNIHKVKCIPHAKPGNWLAPGNVTVVIVPRLHNKNAINPLQPRVDSNTLSQVVELLQTSGAMQAKYFVQNPAYQKLQVEFAVKFKIGYEFNYYSAQLNAALLQHLSPWAYDDVKDISFGGRIYKSVLVDFVEELDYVDYVTNFKLYSYINATQNLLDSDEVFPASPDAILVSETSHVITEVE